MQQGLIMGIINRINTMEKFIIKNLPKTKEEMVFFLKENDYSSTALVVSVSSHFCIRETLIRIGFDDTDSKIKESIKDDIINLREVLEMETGLTWRIEPYSDIKTGLTWHIQT
jgi:hypothetical protein